MTRQRLKKGQRLEARLSEQQCELIGEFIANWSHLELVLEKLIWHFLKLVPEDGRIITSTLDARPKVRMIRQLAKRISDTARSASNYWKWSRSSKNYKVTGISWLMAFGQP
jgi:hypothetical protein